jgi:hypothetical protein
MLHAVFVGAAVDSYIEDLIVVLVSFIVGVPLLIAILKQKMFENKAAIKK